MIKPVGERLGLSAEDAYMFCSLAVDLRVTQLVDGNKGIHAMLKKPDVWADGTLRNPPRSRAAEGRPIWPGRGCSGCCQE